MQRWRQRIVICAILAQLACSAGSGPTDQGMITPPPAAPPPPPAVIDSTWDVAALGIPAIIQANYIDVSRIDAVSTFRSGVGHDYSDEFEHCRSMKHYFRPKGNTDWSTVAITVPVTGRISRLIDEFAGTQVQVTSSAFPAFTIAMFHVNPAHTLHEGDSLTAGTPLGTHISSVTTSDITIRVRTPLGRQLVSYFAAMSDSVFAPYAARGIAGREAFVLPRASRDAAPLGCNGESFVGGDGLVQWVGLQ